MAEQIISGALTPEQLAMRAGVAPSVVKTLILSGRLRYVDGIIPKSECLRYLREVGQKVQEIVNQAPAPVAGFAAKPENIPDEPAMAENFDPEDPNWTQGCERARLEQVADLLARVVPIRRIIKQKSADWGCSPARVETYIKRAYADLSALAELGKVARRDQYRDAISEVLQECMAERTVYDREGNELDVGPRDLKTAITAIDRLIKLDGCYPVENKRVTVETAETPSNPDKIRERIAALMQNPEALARAAAALQEPAAPKWSDRVDAALGLEKVSAVEGDLPDVTGSPEKETSSDPS